MFPKSIPRTSVNSGGCTFLYNKVFGDLCDVKWVSVNSNQVHVQQKLSSDKSILLLLLTSIGIGTSEAHLRSLVWVEPWPFSRVYILFACGALTYRPHWDRSLAEMLIRDHSTISPFFRSRFALVRLSSSCCNVINSYAALGRSGEVNTIIFALPQ